MLLPDGDRAVVEDTKLLDYVLSPDHPVGRHHAVLFEKSLGITRANFGLLKEQKRCGSPSLDRSGLGRYWRCGCAKSASPARG